MARAKKQAAAPAETAAADATPAPVPRAGITRFVSLPVLLLGVLVGLLSLAVDYMPAPIEPVELQYDFAPRTLKQQEKYENGVGRAPNSKIFEQAEHVLDGQLLAPEEIVVSPDGKKAFTGLRDGRVVYFTSDDKTGKLTMHDFGRTGNYQPTCGEEETETICGRPLGLAFVDGAAYARYVTRIEDPTFFANSTMLLVADAYKGLILMDAYGKSTKVFDSVGPRRIKFFNALAVTKSGEVYITDSSRRWFRREVSYEVLERQPTGRLIHFDPVTMRASVIAKDLAFPNGIELVDNESALLVGMTTQNKIVKFKLKTKKFQDFAFLPGMPDNLWIDKKEDGKQELFVGLTSLQPAWHVILLGQPKVRKLMSIVIPMRFLRRLASPHGAFVKVDMKTGDVTHVYKDSDGSARFLSGVQGFGDYYYLTTWMRDNLIRIPKKALK